MWLSTENDIRHMITLAKAARLRTFDNIFKDVFPDLASIYSMKRRNSFFSTFGLLMLPNLYLLEATYFVKYSLRVTMNMGKQLWGFSNYS